MQIGQMEKYPRNLVARDDVLDAMVLMVVGMLSKTELVDSAGSDERGLRIHMTLPKTR